MTRATWASPPEEAIKSADSKDKRIATIQERITETGKAARDAQAKASAIDAAVFDLKAVNPNAIVKIDTRTPEEVIESIAEQGKIVSDALATLRGLLGDVG